jgi:hypothetical protein
VVLNRLPSGRSGLIQIPASDSQRRLEAILTDPEGYFARAHAHAWDQASTEVDAELAARAHARRNGQHDRDEQA